MKNIIKITFILLAIVNFSFAQNSKYETAMKTNVDKIRNAESETTFIETANAFNRIAQAENDKWLPKYYAAYSFVIASFMEKDEDKKDDYVEAAFDLIDEAMVLSPQNSEVYALKAYAIQAHTSISPMIRGALNSSKMNKAAGKSIKYDANNPRPHYLLGQNLYFTPSFFGGGAENACPHFTKAQELFNNFSAENDFMPTWGADRNIMFVGKCNAE